MLPSTDEGQDASVIQKADRFTEYGTTITHLPPAGGNNRRDAIEMIRELAFGKLHSAPRELVIEH